MRKIRLGILIAALTTCVGASECGSSSSGGGGKASSSSFSTQSNTDETRSSGPVSPMPEPGSAALFGIGVLIAAAAARRWQAPRD